MDPAQQERRIGILTVILVLLVVMAFWMLYPHKWPFRTEAHEDEPGMDAQTVKLKTTLEGIPLLAGDDPGTVRPLPLNQANLSAVLGRYATKFDCATLEAHYKEEFVKRGFTYSGTNESSKSGPANTKRPMLSFSSPDFGATLSCTEMEGPFRPYRIILWAKTRG